MVWCASCLCLVLNPSDNWAFSLEQPHRVRADTQSNPNDFARNRQTWSTWRCGEVDHRTFRRRRTFSWWHADNEPIMWSDPTWRGANCVCESENSTFLFWFWENYFLSLALIQPWEMFEKAGVGSEERSVCNQDETQKRKFNERKMFSDPFWN